MLGPLISGGLGLLGTFLGNQQRDQGKEREIELQREFAQNGLRWKVEDAQRAGVHPLAALGATGASYSPVGLGDNDTASGLSGMGQDIGRAIDATRTQPERMGAVSAKMEALGLERAGLENELLRAQIMDITRPRTPPFPMAGSDYPMPGQPGSRSIEAGNMTFEAPPGWSPAQKVEDELGDPAQFLYSIPAIGAWLVHNAVKDLPRVREQYRETPVRGSQFYN